MKWNLASTPVLPMQTYYEKWAAAVAVTSIERGTITQKDLDEALGMSHATPEVLCALLPLSTHCALATLSRIQGLGLRA